MKNQQININKNSETLIGRMLVRGYSHSKPFYSKTLGIVVGNMRNAITYISRDGVSEKAVEKVKLSKAEMLKILSLPKKRIRNFSEVLENILKERILSDKILVDEFKKLIKQNINIYFKAFDENGIMHDNMHKYCKCLDAILSESDFRKKIMATQTFVKKPIILNKKVANEKKK